jgi:hypothetical protein
VRISLVDQEAKGKKRGQRRKKRGRSHRFDAAISQPQIQARPRSKGRRAPTRRGSSRPRPRPGAVARELPAPAQRRLAWRRFLIRVPALLALAGLVGLIAYASTDARFFVYEAGVTGARHIPAETIYQEAGVHEQNIFWIRPEAVAERILRLDGITAVRVRCDLPARVSIAVEEREPVVMWRAQAQQRDWWLDQDGWVLPYPGDAESPQMLFVVDFSERHLEPRGRLQPPGLVDSVQQLAAALPNTRIFFYDTERGLSFIEQQEGSEWPVYVGTSDDLPRKIQVLQIVRQHLLDNRIQPRYVDVRWADHPVYNVPGGTAAGKSE